jgi:hypothetical protein
MELREALITYMRHEPGPMVPASVAAELAMLARAGAGWPVAAEGDWLAVMKDMLADGLFRASARGYFLNHERIAEQEAIDTKQGLLF